MSYELSKPVIDDLNPINLKGEYHGYCTFHYQNGNIYGSGYKHNGKNVGYWVYHGNGSYPLEFKIKKTYYII